MRRLRSILDEPDLSGTRYRLLRRIAGGGMGTVHLVEDVELGREVALKVLGLPDPSGDLSARLRREARLLARLDHPNIVPVHDVDRLPDGRVYYAMKYVRGQRLDEWRKGSPPRPAMLRLFQRVCAAVAFAHSRGVIHRDLKPENVMVGAFGEALVVDWGLAKLVGETMTEAPAQVVEGGPSEESGMRSAGSSQAPTLPPGGAAARGASAVAGDPAGTGHGAILGTPAYMSPEQARGETAKVDERSDVHALGAILYFLLCGAPPFEGQSAAEARRLAAEGSVTPLRRRDASIPRALESICSRAMSRDPAKRYETAEEMAADVESFLDGLPVLAHRETLLEKGARLARRHQALLLLVLAYLLARVLILVLAGR